MRLLLLVCLFLLAAACDQPTSRATDPNDANMVDNGMAERSAPIGSAAGMGAESPPGVLGGIYQGMLPCADCAGIETVLYLYPDSTYLERRTYLDLPKEGIDEQLSSGRWVQVSANLLRLTRPKEAGGPTDYRLRAHGLQQLDLDGQEVTGDLAGRYILAQVGSF
jgi:hypothetical protein